MSLNKNSCAKDFRAFFEVVPAAKWCVGQLTDESGCHCAMGHILDAYPADSPQESEIILRLRTMLYDGDLPTISAVNDSGHIFNVFKQSTPKKRILAMCDSLIEKGF